MTDATEKAFWALVDNSNQAGCWPWRGVLNEKGYGVFHTCGGRVMAHVYAYTLKHGPVPVDKPELNHKCKFRACVRDHHLEPVTHADNVRYITRDGCRRGHPWHVDTTYVKPGNGERCCKICRRAYRRDIYHMKKGTK